MTILMLATVMLPLLALVPAGGTFGRGSGVWLALAPLPALALALLFRAGELALPGLLLGGAWVLDDIRANFLLLTALLWLLAGVYAGGYMSASRTRGFRVFWLLTLTGNLGLILAADIPGFYSFFALMTFAAYGLIVHAGTDEARRAGRIYLIMAVLGETLLLTGFLLAAEEAGSLMLAELPEALAGAHQRALLVTLVGLGFGVKAGLPLLHFWLPLAHPVAPTPASAVLSGAMIKAGLLGWLLVLPLGTLTGWSDAVILVGTLGALGGAAIGVAQRNPKTVLAYSSISQMGLMVLLVGAALAHTALARALVPVLALYALHHGLAKGALFLSAGLHWPATRWGRAGLWVLVALPGLALAGLPWTSGAVAKLAAKKAWASAPATGMLALVPELMALGAVATTLLVVRFLYRLARHRETGHNNPVVVLAWAASLITSLVVFWWLPWPDALASDRAAFLRVDEAMLWKLSWPLLAGLGCSALVMGVRIRAPGIPPGDGVVVPEYLIRWVGRRSRRGSMRLTRPVWPDVRKLSEQAEDWIGTHTGVVFLALLVTALALLIR